MPLEVLQRHTTSRRHALHMKEPFHLSFGDIYQWMRLVIPKCSEIGYSIVSKDRMPFFLNVSQVDRLSLFHTLSQFPFYLTFVLYLDSDFVINLRWIFALELGQELIH